MNLNNQVKATKKDLEVAISNIEPIIDKKSGFNLNKSDSLELNDSNTLATSKSVSDLNIKVEALSSGNSEIKYLDIGDIITTTRKEKNGYELIPADGSIFSKYTYPELIEIISPTALNAAKAGDVYTPVNEFHKKVIDKRLPYFDETDAAKYFFYITKDKKSVMQTTGDGEKICYTAKENEIIHDLVKNSSHLGIVLTIQGSAYKEHFWGYPLYEDLAFKKFGYNHSEGTYSDLLYEETIYYGQGRINHSSICIDMSTNREHYIIAFNDSYLYEDYYGVSPTDNEYWDESYREYDYDDNIYFVQLKSDNYGENWIISNDGFIMENIKYDSIVRDGHFDNMGYYSVLRCFINDNGNHFVACESNVIINKKIDYPSGSILSRSEQNILNIRNTENISVGCIDIDGDELYLYIVEYKNPSYLKEKTTTKYSFSFPKKLNDYRISNVSLLPDNSDVYGVTESYFISCLLTPRNSLGNNEDIQINAIFDIEVGRITFFVNEELNYSNIYFYFNFGKANTIGYNHKSDDTQHDFFTFDIDYQLPLDERSNAKIVAKTIESN